MTGKEVLDSALDLCGLRDETGNTNNNVGDLVQRSVSLINILLAKYEQLNSRVTGEIYRVKHIESLNTSIDMHQMILQCILPFALAALLIQDEDAALASRFESAASDAEYILNALPVTDRKSITEVY